MTDEQPTTRRAAREAAQRAAETEAAVRAATGSESAPEPADALPTTVLPEAAGESVTTVLPESADAVDAPVTTVLSADVDADADATPTTVLSDSDADEPPAAAPPKAPGGLAGIGAMLRRHPTAWMVSAGAVVFLLLGTASVFAGIAWGSPADASPAESSSPTAEAEEPRPVSTLPATAIRLRTCSIAGPAADGRLVTLAGSVMRADTGELLFDRSGTQPLATASVLKVFTAAAALSVLGPEYRITTSVYEGSSPGTIVLVGRGDATLSALPAGQESFYSGAPKLQTLAETTIANYQAKYPDVPITQVVLDATYWNAGDAWDSSWATSEQTQGYHSYVTALQVDGDRADPRASTSPRSTDPIGRAGAAFLDALRAADTSGTVVDPGIGTTLGAAVGRTALAEVVSQPVSVLIPQMLLPSDNTLAEMLARVVSKESGMNGSASSLQQAIPAAIARYGVSPTGIAVRDGSGLSDLNAVPAATMTAFMIQVHAGEAGLAVIRDGLPVAGRSGTLAGRFTGDNAVARGSVVAKTGWIDTSYSLSGFLTAADGTPLAFTFYAYGAGIAGDARAALDTLTTAAFHCGDNLSNN